MSDIKVGTQAQIKNEFIEVYQRFFKVEEGIQKLEDELKDKVTYSQWFEHRDQFIEVERLQEDFESRLSSLESKLDEVLEKLEQVEAKVGIA